MPRHSASTNARRACFVRCEPNVGYIITTEMYPASGNSYGFRSGNSYGFRSGVCVCFKTLLRASELKHTVSYFAGVTWAKAVPWSSLLPIEPEVRLGHIPSNALSVAELA